MQIRNEVFLQFRYFFLQISFSKQCGKGKVVYGSNLYLENLANNVIKEDLFSRKQLAVVHGASQHHFTLACEKSIRVLQSLVMIIHQHYNK